MVQTNLNFLYNSKTGTQGYTESSQRYTERFRRKSPFLCVPLCTLWLNFGMIPAPRYWYIAVFALMIREHRPGLCAGHEPGSRWGGQGVAMAVKLQNKNYSNTLPCTRCPKGGRVQPAVGVCDLSLRKNGTRMTRIRRIHTDFAILTFIPVIRNYHSFDFWGLPKFNGSPTSLSVALFSPF